MTGLMLGGLRLRRAALVTALALTLAGFGAWTRAPDPALLATDRAPTVDVWILDNGFHTDLALPRALLEADDDPLARAVRDLPPGDWILVGWGDARFYVETSPISGRLLNGARAFLAPGNASVVMLDPSLADPETAYRPGVAHRIRLSEPGYRALERRLEASLRVEDGRLVPGPTSQIGDGRFFESVETFWIGHLCNHWTGELLHAGGLPLRAVRSIVSAEIVGMARRSQVATQAAGPTGEE
jgi:hypothetical protein